MGHHRLKGHECEQAPEDSERQGRLTSCSPWGHKELDVTERLNNKRRREGKGKRGGKFGAGTLHLD